MGSNCAYLDGITYAIGSTDPVQNGTTLEIECKIKIESLGGLRVIVSKYKPISGERGFLLAIHESGALLFWISSDGDNAHTITTDILLIGNVVYDIKVQYNNGDIVITANDMEYSVTSHIKSIYNGNSQPLLIGTYGNSSTRFNGWMYGLKIKSGNITNKFNMSEGGLSDTLYNSGTGSDATLVNATLLLFWGTQDIHHANYKNGFDLWYNSVAEDYIRVPIGATVTQSGYVFVSSNPAGIGLNNCESKIKFDSTLAAANPSVPDPLGYDDFETDFGDNHEVYSCVNKGKSILFYNPALSEANHNKLINCLIKKGCTE